MGIVDCWSLTYMRTNSQDLLASAALSLTVLFLKFCVFVEYQIAGVPL